MQSLRKYNRGHIGEIFTTNEGYTATIIDGGSKANYCTIKINDWVAEVRYYHLKRGAIKYPLHPSVFGKGYFGIGIFSQKDYPAMYNTWIHMLTRAYCSSYLSKQPTYLGVTVCAPWLNFQEFGKWYIKSYIEGYVLDKDLLVNGNKEYSPDTCIFIPSQLNSFLANNYSNNTSGYTGVLKRRLKTGIKWVAAIKYNGKNKYLGTFTSPQLASQAYKDARLKEADKLRELYKDILPQRALDAIR